MAEEDLGTEAPKGKKKLLIIIIAAVVLLAGGGGAAFFMMGSGGDEAVRTQSRKPNRSPLRPIRCLTSILLSRLCLMSLGMPKIA